MNEQIKDRIKKMLMEIYNETGLMVSTIEAEFTYSTFQKKINTIEVSGINVKMTGV